MSRDDNAAPAAPFVERRKRWSFFMLADGSWVWRVLHPDGSDAHSSVSFPTADECTANASRHGYVARRPEEERRRRAEDR
jgi:hypothetical protein